MLSLVRYTKEGCAWSPVIIRYTPPKALHHRGLCAHIQPGTTETHKCSHASGDTYTFIPDTSQKRVIHTFQSTVTSVNYFKAVAY